MAVFVPKPYHSEPINTLLAFLKTAKPPMMPDMLAHLMSIGLENESPKLIDLENEFREFEMFILKMQKRIASEHKRFVFTDKKFNIDPRGPDGMPTGSAAARHAKKEHIIAEMEQSAYLKELEDTGNKLATLIKRKRLGKRRGRRHLIPRIGRPRASRELLGRRNSIASVANNEWSNNEDEATGIINNNGLNEGDNAHIAVAGAGADPGANAGRPRGSSNASTVANGHSRRPSNAWSSENENENENETSAAGTKGGASKRRTRKHRRSKNKTHKRKAAKRTT